MSIKYKISKTYKRCKPRRGKRKQSKRRSSHKKQSGGMHPGFLYIHLNKILNTFSPEIKDWITTPNKLNFIISD